MKTIQPKGKLGLSSKASLPSGKNRTCKAEKMFWEMIDQIRKEELGRLDPQSAEVRPKSKKLRETLRGSAPEHLKQIRRDDSIVLQENSFTLDFAFDRSRLRRATGFVGLC